MDQILKDDAFYILSILLTCVDKSARVNTEKLLAFVINRCFEIEKDDIYKVIEREIEYEEQDENG
jgi:hypothetical protein